MHTVTIPQIDERLKRLPTEKLAVVYDFVCYLLDQQTKRKVSESEAFQTILASEAVLRREWNRPEEDEEWAAFRPFCRS